MYSSDSSRLQAWTKTPEEVYPVKLSTIKLAAQDSTGIHFKNTRRYSTARGPFSQAMERSRHHACIFMGHVVYAKKFFKMAGQATARMAAACRSGA